MESKDIKAIQTSRFMHLLKTNPCVWPLTFAAFAVGPSLILAMAYHKFHGPEIFWRKDPEPWNKFENRKMKLYTSIDVENYEHPRPRFEYDNKRSTRRQQIEGKF